jgi:hypothetical protein
MQSQYYRLPKKINEFFVKKKTKKPKTDLSFALTLMVFLLVQNISNRFYYTTDSFPQLCYSSIMPHFDDHSFIISN